MGVVRFGVRPVSGHQSSSPCHLNAKLRGNVKVDSGSGTRILYQRGNWQAGI